MRWTASTRVRWAAAHPWVAFGTMGATPSRGRTSSWRRSRWPRSAPACASPCRSPWGCSRRTSLTGRRATADRCAGRWAPPSRSSSRWPSASWGSCVARVSSWRPCLCLDRCSACCRSPSRALLARWWSPTLSAWLAWRDHCAMQSRVCVASLAQTSDMRARRANLGPWLYFCRVSLSCTCRLSGRSTRLSCSRSSHCPSVTSATRL
mmetsp:Transcript_179/g.759  ORF Transcript_179/g.759 Transcript_179/m.759 type:complete len:207 (-) Transcript_179:1978-2598(-)